MISILIRNKESSDLSDIIFHNTSKIKDGVVVYKGIEYKVDWNPDGDSSKYDYSFWYNNAYELSKKNIDISNQYKDFTIEDNVLSFHGEHYPIKLNRYNSLGSGYIPNTLKNKFLLTQTLFAWNKYGGIRLWKEYENIHHNLNHKYKLGLFVSRMTPFRKKLIEELSHIKEVFINQYIIDEKIQGKIGGVTQYNFLEEPDIDFLNLKKCNPDITSYPFKLDFFFRVIPKSKSVILIETDESKTNPSSYKFLTEKTYGLILARIPFIPTNIFICNMLRDIGFEPHPFEKDIKKIDNNPKKIKEFIREYLLNEEHNHNVIQEWSNKSQDYLLKKLYTDNSLLENLEFFKQGTKLI